MKDSRLGTFGVTGLILIIALKFFSLKEFESSTIPLIIVAGNVLSRFAAVRMLARGNYVQNNNAAKAGSAAERLSLVSLLTNIIFAIAPLLFFQNWYVFIIIIPLLITEQLMYQFYKKWIGGYNGDCAGAVQQLTEVIFYLSLIALWKFI